MTYSTTLTSKGQVTIPVGIRRSLGLKAGETVRFKISPDNQVTVEKNDWKNQLNSLHNEVAAHLKKNHIKPLSDVGLDNAIDNAAGQSVAERYRTNQS